MYNRREETMPTDANEELAKQLEATGDYRVLRRLVPHPANLLTAPATTLLAKNSAQKENYCRCQQHRNHRQNQMGPSGFRGSVLKPF
jgi:hypothetical protein